MMVYSICCLNTSHQPEKQRLERACSDPTLSPSPGIGSVKSSVYHLGSRVQCFMLPLITQKEINPTSSRKGLVLDSRDCPWPPATPISCPAIPVMSTVSQCPVCSGTVLKHTGLSMHCYWGKLFLSVRG